MPGTPGFCPAGLLRQAQRVRGDLKNVIDSEICWQSSRLMGAECRLMFFTDYEYNLRDSSPNRIMDRIVRQPLSSWPDRLQRFWRSISRR